MLNRFLGIPLFFQNMVFNKLTWYKQPILWLLVNKFKTRYLILIFAWQFKVKETETTF
jgi:hypothetical protein